MNLKGFENRGGGDTGVRVISNSGALGGRVSQDPWGVGTGRKRISTILSHVQPGAVDRQDERNLGRGKTEEGRGSQIGGQTLLGLFCSKEKG